MEFNLKTYKHLKIKYYIKKTNFFFFFHGTSLNSSSWIKIEQAFVNHQLKYFRIFNKLMINILKNSIFKNLTLLINGPIILLNTNNVELTLKKLKSISPLITLIGLRINYKVYSKEQIQNLKKMSYLENLLIFHRTMGNSIKTPY